jgi:hypothetical protein
MALPGPSRTIEVEPIEVPQPVEQPVEDAPPVEAPEQEPVHA